MEIGGSDEGAAIRLLLDFQQLQTEDRSFIYCKKSFGNFFLALEELLHKDPNNLISEKLSELIFVAINLLCKPPCRLIHAPESVMDGRMRECHAN